MRQVENFYKAEITDDWSIGTGKFYVSKKPKIDAGWLVVSPNNPGIREVIEYEETGSDANGDFIIINKRGLTGTDEQIHIIGEPIRMNVDENYWKYITDAIDDVVASGAPNADTETKGLVKIASYGDIYNNIGKDEDGVYKVVSSEKIANLPKSVKTINGAFDEDFDVERFNSLRIIKINEPVVDLIGGFTGEAQDGKEVDVMITVGDNDILYQKATLPSSASWQSVTYGDGKFVTVAYNSTKAAYSTDGINWTPATLPSSADWYSVTYGDGKFVTVAYNSTKAAYSTDGINWTSATLPSSAYWRSVTYGDGKFVTVAYNSDKAAYSTDGINWTSATLPSSASWESVTYGDGKFVTVAYNSDDFVRIIFVGYVSFDEKDVSNTTGLIINKELFFKLIYYKPGNKWFIIK